MAAARDRGVKIGRPAKLSHRQQQEVIRTVRDGSKATDPNPFLAGGRRVDLFRRRKPGSD